VHTKLAQILKSGSPYILFRICLNLRKRYYKGHFWNENTFIVLLGQISTLFLIALKNKSCTMHFHKKIEDTVLFFAKQKIARRENLWMMEGVRKINFSDKSEIWYLRKEIENIFFRKT